MLLNFTKTPFKLKSPKPRSMAQDGNQIILFDFSLETNLQAEFLNMLSKGLAGAFYLPFNKKKKGQVDSIAEQEQRMTELRFNGIKSFNWDETLVGYHVIIEKGLFAEPIKMDGCTITDFHFYIGDGGTVKSRFKVTCKPDTTSMGLLCSIVNGEVDITIYPPTAEELDQMNFPGTGGDDDEEEGDEE